MITCEAYLFCTVMQSICTLGGSRPPKKKSKPAYPHLSTIPGMFAEVAFRFPMGPDIMTIPRDRFAASKSFDIVLQFIQVK